MASAIALTITAQTIEAPNVKLSLQVFYFDQGLGISQEQAVYVFFLPTATVQQIENAVEDAIISQAQSYYPTMVLTRGDIIMFDIKKGS